MQEEVGGVSLGFPSLSVASDLAICGREGLYALIYQFHMSTCAYLMRMRCFGRVSRATDLHRTVFATTRPVELRTEIRMA